MRERDMRQSVEHFLQTRLRKMVAPATLGLGLAGFGLATTGCPSSGLDANDDGGAMVNKDAGADQGMVLKYMAQMPDAGLVQPDYMAPVPPDAGSKLDTLGTPIYSAPSPDAGPVMRYMAQMPDASRDLQAMPLYMAQLPFGSS